MNMIFLSLLIFTFSYQVYGFSPPAGYCEATKSTDEYELSDIYTCFKDKEVLVSIDELLTFSKKLSHGARAQVGLSFHKRLQEKAMMLLLEKRRSYDSLYGAKIPVNKDLLEFRGSTKRGKGSVRSRILKEYDTEEKRELPQVNKSNQADILNLSMANALMARSLFYENRNYAADKQQGLAKKNFANLKCENKKKVCKKNHSIWESTFECTEEYEACTEKNEKDYVELVAKLDEKRKPLLDMVETNPLLFSNKIDGSYLSFFASDELQPSSFMKRLIDEIPLSLQKEYYQKYKKNGFNSQTAEKDLNQFFKDHENQFVTISEKIEENSRPEFEAGIYDQIQKLDEMSFDLLNAKEKILHHYPGLIEQVFNDIIAESKSEEELKDSLALAQAGYCYLMQEYPIEQGMSSSAITGFVLLGVGMGLQFIPGIGTVAGAAIWSARIGGSLMTLDGLNDVVNSYDKLNQEVALHTGGVIAYQKLMETKNDRDMNTALVGLDSALIGVDLIMLRSLKIAKMKQGRNNEVDEELSAKSKQSISETKNSRRYDNQRRKMLDDMEESYGGSDETQRVITKYFPDNEYPISNADKIYLTSMEKMIRNDLKANNIGISEVEIDSKAKEILTAIAKKCVRDGN